MGKGEHEHISWLFQVVYQQRRRAHSWCNDKYDSILPLKTNWSVENGLYASQLGKQNSPFINRCCIFDSASKTRNMIIISEIGWRLSSTDMQKSAKRRLESPQMGVQRWHCKVSPKNELEEFVWAASNGLLAELASRMFNTVTAQSQK